MIGIQDRAAALRVVMLVMLSCALIVGARGRAAASGEDAASGAGGSPATPPPAPPKAPAAKESAAPGGSMVGFKSGTETVQAYLAVPKGAGPHPGVIVIQEWWGLNAQIMGVADRLASQGYVAIAPDLYRGKVTDKPETALELARSLPEARAAADLEGAFAFLRSHASVGERRIGSIGFCMGGHLSFVLAQSQPDLGACVICYGRVESDRAKLASLKAPVLGVFGGQDKGIPVEMVEAFRSTMQGAGKSVEIKIFPEAGHGFMNPNNPGHKPEETKLAWSLIDSFLAANLRKD